MTFSTSFMGTWYRVLAGVRHFFLLYIIKTDSGVHPASCPTDTGGSFPGV
jgi:hypothetical protein